MCKEQNPAGAPKIEITDEMVQAAMAVLHESGYLDYCSSSDRVLVREMLEAAVLASPENVRVQL